MTDTPTGPSQAQVVYITVELPEGSESFFLPGGVEFEVVEDTLVIRDLRTDKNADDKGAEQP